VPAFAVALVPAPDQVVVRLTGDTDLSTAPELNGGLARAAAFGTRQVVVDVAAVRFWDCSGLHALAAFTAELRRAGRACRVVGAPSATRRLIAAADLTDRLDLDGALREFPETARVREPGPSPARRSTTWAVPDPVGAGLAAR
jgi:anti-anti-sigma factor